VTTAGELVRTDVITCGLADHVREVGPRISQSPYGFALVMSTTGVLLGRLRASALNVAPETTAEDLMESGPSTVRRTPRPTNLPSACTTATSKPRSSPRLKATFSGSHCALTSSSAHTQPTECADDSEGLTHMVDAPKEPPPPSQQIATVADLSSVRLISAIRTRARRVEVSARDRINPAVGALPQKSTALNSSAVTCLRAVISRVGSNGSSSTRAQKRVW
jgi:hypothetical protein